VPAYREVIAFWFDEIEPKSWWSADPAFDAMVRARYGETLARAAKAELHQWRREPEGRLAEILVLDQFSRNVHRNTPQAFAQDPLALALAQEAIAAGAAPSLEPSKRTFLYMPFMHSESKAIHLWAEALFREDGIDPDNLKYELRHKAIIDRFGRYPHRNEILGRVSSADELEFLQQPGSRF